MPHGVSTVPNSAALPREFLSPREVISIALLSLRLQIPFKNTCALCLHSPHHQYESGFLPYPTSASKIQRNSSPPTGGASREQCTFCLSALNRGLFVLVPRHSPVQGITSPKLKNSSCNPARSLAHKDIVSIRTLPASPLEHT